MENVRRNEGRDIKLVIQFLQMDKLFQNFFTNLFVEHEINSLMNYFCQFLGHI